MRATELFAIFAFIKSLERIYLTPGFTPSFVSSGVVSVPSLPPVLLNIISYDFFGTSLEVPALSTAAPVNMSTIFNAPTCIVYISRIARPRFSPAPIIPPRPQPICLNRHLHPKFEAPGPKSLWNIPSPFPPPSKSILPNSPFCLPTDEPDIESDNEIENENESIWLSLLLSPTVLTTVWNLCRLFVRRPLRSSTAQPEPVDKQGVHSSPWSQSDPVIPRREKVEYKDRVTQPRIFISTLPSLPARSDTFIIMARRPAECNTLPTVSVSILPSPLTTETSLSSPDRTATPVAVISEMVPHVVVQTEVTTSSYAPSPSFPADSSLDEPAVQQPASSHPPTPILSAASVLPLVSEDSQSGLKSLCWAPTPESALVVSSDAPELSSSLPAREDTIATSASSLPTPTPTPVKKKRVRTRGPKHLRVPKTALPTVETTTRESSSQSITSIGTPSNSLSDSIWAPKAAETAPEKDNVPIPPTDVLNIEVPDSGVLSAETAVKTPSKLTCSLSDSVWASKLSEATPEKNVAPIVASPPSEERVSGVQGSIWAVAPDVPPLTTTLLTIKTPSEASSPLSPSIWTPESTEDVVSPVTLSSSEDKASGLRNSIWATTPEAPEVPKVVVPAASSAPASNPPESSSSQLASENTSEVSTALSTSPQVKKKRVRTRGPKNLRIQSTVAPMPIAEVSIPTTVVVETLSEASSSLSRSIWAPKSSKTTPDNILVMASLSEEKASGLKDSIWATACDVSEVVVPSATLPTPPSSAKKVSSLEASIWADDTPAIAALSAPVPICEEDLLACERRNDSASASRWADAPDAPSTPRRFVKRGGANRWKGRRGCASSRA